MRRRARGMTLIESLIYMTVMVMAYGVLQSVLITHHGNNERAVRAATDRSALTRLEWRIRQDIMVATDVKSHPGRVELSTATGKVVWDFVTSDRLVREVWVDGQRIAAERLRWEVVGEWSRFGGNGWVKISVKLDDPTWDRSVPVELVVTEALGSHR